MPIRDMILVHLYQYRGFRRARVFPFAICQEGIERALQIKQPQVSKGIKELKLLNLIVEKSGVVEGGGVRKVYFLSQKGVRRAKKIVAALEHDIFSKIAPDIIALSHDYSINALKSVLERADLNVDDRVRLLQSLSSYQDVLDLIAQVCDDETIEACDNVDLLLFIGESFINAGMWERAYEVLEKCLKIAEGKTKGKGLILYGIAKYALGKKNADRAIKDGIKMVGEKIEG
ncbi:MAG: hypothetical protein DRN20_03745 [Thermoplasmata archaeon]|nr:MAG: hypothetical protein DRN20_03745 [Thermoplasmata archaeon]